MYMSLRRLGKVKSHKNTKRNKLIAWAGDASRMWVVGTRKFTRTKSQAEGSTTINP